ncbi:DNA replication factor C complex subunit 2, partial [Haematococcus lacustris]
MEIYSSTTRFALACNQSTKIIEPIQSRCAIVRYAKIGDQDILKRLLVVCAKEKVNYTEDGLEAVIFTADGDMRQALNNMQATHSGFGLVNQESVFKVCDQPHPLVVARIIEDCSRGNLEGAYVGMKTLCDSGYSSMDIITTLFRVVRNSDLAEFLKLEFLKEVGFCHMRIGDGVNSRLQLSGLLAKLCRYTSPAA